MIWVEFTDYTNYLAGFGEGVCVDNAYDIHNHNDNHNEGHNLGKLADFGKDGVRECLNTKTKYLIQIGNGKFSPGWG